MLRVFLILDIKLKWGNKKKMKNEERMVFDLKFCCKIGLGFCFVFLGMIWKDLFMGCKFLFFVS